MEKLEIIFDLLYFALFISANIWLFIVITVVCDKIFQENLKVDLIGKIMALGTAILSGLAVILVIPAFVLLLIHKDIWYYELLTQFAFLGVFASILSNMLLARFKWREDYFIEQEEYGILKHLDTVDILSLSISFIFAGSCAFFYCKSNH